jgi:hypothetical protein
MSSGQGDSMSRRIHTPPIGFLVWCEHLEAPFLLCVRPFAMSRTLPPAFDYYDLCWLLPNHIPCCHRMRYVSLLFSCCLIRSYWLAAYQYAQACFTSCLTGNLSNSIRHRPVGQISPDKNVNFHCTTAAFTLSPESWVSLCRANLPGGWALYAVSVRQLAVLRSGFLQTPSREDALAVG